MWEAIYIALLGVLGALVTERLRARPKVIYYFPPGAFFAGDENVPTNISADSVFIRNSGSKAAKDVEILLSRQPLKLAIRPARHIEQESINGGTIIQIGSLGPKEEVGVHLLTTPPETATVIWIRSEEGLAAATPIAFQKQYPPWFNFLAGFLFLLGSATLSLILFPVFRLLGEAMVSIVSSLTASIPS